MSEILMQILWIIFIPFVFVAAIMPYIKNVALKIGAVDMPRKRHIHKKPMPKMGGVAVFLGFLLGYMIFGTHSSIMNAVLIGGFLVVLVGVMDDLTELGSLTKFIGQLASASVLTIYGGLLIKDISAFGFYIDFGIFAYPFTIFFILGCINCINLIDGLDGLSGGISAIYFLTIGIIATLQGHFGLDFVIAFIMFGAVLGFLVHNFPPASIFAGDSGSMFFGFMISVIALLGFKNVTVTSFIVPLLILAIPIFDTLFAIIRRTLKGQNAFTHADKFHIHHQLLNRNLSQKTTVLIIYAIDLLFAFASILYVLKDNLAYIFYLILTIIVIIFACKTNVIVDREVLKNKIKQKWTKKKKV